MPLIMPIKDLRNTTEISNIAHKEQEPIFITKNGYSDFAVMSSDLYDKFARMNGSDEPRIIVYVETIKYQGRNL